MKKSKSNKKSGLEKTLLDSSNIELKGSLVQDYNFGWGTDSNTYEYSDIYDYGYSYNPGPKDIYTTQAIEADNVKTEWLGALVRFNTRYYNRGITSVFSGPPSLVVDPNGSNTSRLSDEDYDYLRYTGTVVDIATHANYKNQWCVNVLWSDGQISYENILDLQIIQPGS